MENANLLVEKELSRLNPPETWQPDASAALLRFRARAADDRGTVRWMRWPAWAAAAALIIATVLLSPDGRGVAQQLWQFLTVRRVAFIQVNRWPQGIPAPKISLVGLPIPPIPARNVEEVRWRVRYVPRLPHAGVLSGDPRLSTAFSMSAGTVIHTADLELALRKVGIADQTVPPQWDGAKLTLHTGMVTIAEWPDIIFAQSLPLTLSAPSTFDFPAFSALWLRVLGVSPEEAQRLAQQRGTAPPWLAPIANFDASVTLEQIVLNSGPATLIYEMENDGSQRRLSVIWSVPDRVYLLSGKINRELAIAAANAVQ